MEFLAMCDSSLLLQEQLVDSTSTDAVSLVNGSITESSSNQSSDPPTHDVLLSLDRVGVSNDPIGPRRRSRRGPTPRTPQQQARSVARRNARERKRVRLVNLGFATLRDHIPPHFGTAAPVAKNKPSNKTTNANNKKLSKVDTLRYAIEYIKQLREAIGQDDKDSTGASAEEFSPSPELSSPPDLSSSPSFCSTPSPVMMLMSASRSPPMFHDDTDNFLDIMDWTTL